jgi:5-methylcytosine-specific restriction endonuclease McrA
MELEKAGQLKTMKKCPECKQIKPEEEFYKNKSKYDGLQSYCKKCIKIKTSQWNKANPRIMRASIRAWKKRNPAKVKAYRTSIKTKISSNIRRYIWCAIKGEKNGHKWEMLVGYSIEDLMKHIEKQFKPGMTWENYGEWQIDHKIPISAFNFSDPRDVDFKRCWALENLQPLWAAENLSKSNKLVKPFQPSLRLQIRNAGS